MFILQRNMKLNKNLQPINYKLQTCGGFTIIELLVVVAVSITISTAGFLGLANFNASQNIKNSLQEVEVALRYGQKRSVTQEDGKTWGVHFANTTSSASEYTLFKGLSYAASTVDRLYNLRKNLSWTNPYTSSTYDAIFTARTGRLPASKVLTMASSRNDGTIGDIILNSVGRITTRKDTGLVGYWHFDEGTATSTYDASGLSNTGSSTAVTWQSGTNCKAGGCINFNGTSDYVLVNNASVLQPSSLTILAWIKTSATTQTGCVAAKQLETSTNDSYALYANSGKMTMCVGAIGGSCVGSSDANNLPSNTWTHFSGVFDGNNTYLYKNGMQIDSDARVITIGYDSNPLYIGADSDNSVVTPETCWFDGTIDEVRVYNRVLTAAEILNMY